MFPWILSIALSVLVLALIFKIYYMRSSINKIEKDLKQHLSSDTNTLLTVNTSDKYIKNLAAQLNKHLKSLKDLRHKFQHGDNELKEAVTNISHDLRTPLTAINGYLQLLEDEDKSEKANNYLKAINDRTQNLTELTGELFKYSIILSTTDKLTFEPVDLNASLQTSLATFYASLKENSIEPQINICDEKVIRKLDKIALNRIFNNILSNAIKYSDGDLYISLESSGKITFSNHASNLNEIQAQKLFNRFFTVESARQSTGLGLAISKTLVEEMGGQISILYEDKQIFILVEFLD